jgi:hypothetical protein
MCDLLALHGACLLILHAPFTMRDLLAFTVDAISFLQEQVYIFTSGFHQSSTVDNLALNWQNGAIVTCSLLLGC